MNNSIKEEPVPILSAPLREALMPYILVYEHVLWPVAQQMAAVGGRGLDRTPHYRLPDLLKGLRRYLAVHGERGMHPELLVAGLRICAREVVSHVVAHFNPPPDLSPSAEARAKVSLAAQILVDDVREELIRRLRLSGTDTVSVEK